MQNSHQSNNISWGVSLIFVGFIYLLDNLGIIEANLHNWWAIFIIMPGINMVYSSWIKSQRSHQINLLQNTSFVPGFLLTGLGLSFLLDFSWDLFIPIALIIFGVSLLTRKQTS